MTLLKFNNFTTNISKKILVTIIKNIYSNLFLNIIDILIINFLLNSRYKFLSTSFLIRPMLFDNIARKIFFFLKADASIDSFMSLTTKLFLISRILIWLRSSNYYLLASLLLKLINSISFLCGIVFTIL